VGTEVLRQGLRELGYAEGRTAIIEWRWWEGKPERLRDAVAEMVRLNLDVIVVGGSEATKAMKEATRTIPIVFFGPSYPVEEGLVQSFARPGSNTTGLPWRSPTTWGRCASAAVGSRSGSFRRRRHLESG
jgi:putative ABC transport system substrate-binding protein